MVTVTKLDAGMDFRLPEYRGEVFLRFYEFHLRYRSHPGAVYYVMPHLAEAGGWSLEDRLWFAYLNGNTQNPVTSYIIFSRYPSLVNVDVVELGKWFHAPATYASLQWDTDRRYHKKSFVSNIENYLHLLRGSSQVEYFGGLCRGNEYANFRRVWDVVSKQFLSFGRLTTFSYLEYLRIMGLGLDCDRLFLEDMAGSRSHRNGLCKVIGRDDLDWHQSNPGFDGSYSGATLRMLESVGERLLSEAQSRSKGQPWERDVSYFTLESALCTYKSWHRPNRRYPNVYNDMFHNRIRYGEQRWARPRLKVLWEAREDALPANLRLEDNPRDVGLHPLKQNHYLRTGQVIMMERDWSCFANDYSKNRITA